MPNETETSGETAPRFLIGDEVIFLPDGSHQVVTGQIVGSAANIGRITVDSKGNEAIEPPSSESLEDIGEIIGHWQPERIVDAWSRTMNLPEEVKQRIQRRLEEMQKQQNRGKRG